MRTHCWRGSGLLGARSLALLALVPAQGACGPSSTVMPPAPGVATVMVSPRAPSVLGLVLQSGTIRLDRLFAVGDVTYPHPGDGGMPTDVVVDLLGPGTSVSFTGLQQGLYSKVSFFAESIHLDGTWHDRPFAARLADVHGPMVTPRAPMGHELGPGQDLELSLTVDVGAWFAGAVLDGCMPGGGSFRIDPQNNGMVGDQILHRVPPSFTLQ